MLPDDGESDFDKDDDSNASADDSMTSNKSSHGLILHDDVKEVSDGGLMEELSRWLCDYLAFFCYHDLHDSIVTDKLSFYCKKTKLKTALFFHFNNSQTV